MTEQDTGLRHVAASAVTHDVNTFDEDRLSGRTARSATIGGNGLPNRDPIGASAVAQITIVDCA